MYHITNSVACFVLLTTGVLFSGFSQECNTELKVYNNSDKRAIMPNDGTIFQLDISNFLSTSQTYFVKTIVYHEPCNLLESLDYSKEDREAPLTALVSHNGARLSNITVPGNSTTRIGVEVNMNDSAKINSWYCVDVVATAQICGEDITKKLNVFISDGREQ